MTHNPAAAHPRLMALLDGMEKIEQAATDGPLEHESMYQTESDPPGTVTIDYTWLGYSFDVETPDGIEPGGLAIVETDYNKALIPELECLALSRNATPPLLAFLRAQAEEHNRAAALLATSTGHVWPAIRAGHITAHHACCTTALAAAAGTPALAVLAGELQKEMEAQDGN